MVSQRLRVAFRSGVISLGLLAILLAGCALEDGGMCIDDSSACIKRRLTALKSMRDDPNHAWVARKPTVREYVSGVRLFAYRASKDSLTCEQLAKGIGETAHAKQLLTPEKTRGISAERVGQIIALAGEVNAELKAAKERRCRA